MNQNKPEIKVIALSNVYCRLMNFTKKGYVEEGHKHTYDHATLVSSGSVLVEMLDNQNNVISSKIVKAPNLVYISKDNKHKITSLEDSTVCCCIHALRTIDEEILSPEFLLDPITFNGSNGQIIHDVIREKTKKEMKFFTSIDGE